jgi:hypothetical protein
MSTASPPLSVRPISVRKQDSESASKKLRCSLVSQETDRMREEAEDLKAKLGAKKDEISRRENSDFADERVVKESASDHQ